MNIPEFGVDECGTVEGKIRVEAEGVTKFVTFSWQGDIICTHMYT